MGYSLALVGAGYLVGLVVGMAMLLGLLISWAGAVPYPDRDASRAAGAVLADYTDHIWRSQVRFIGAGAIAVASVWTLLKLIGPVVSGVVSTMSASRARKRRHRRPHDTDMSPGWIGADRARLSRGHRLAALPVPRADAACGQRGRRWSIAAMPFVFIGGFMIAAICGYMAGLIGASNSPISGVGILAILFCSIVFVAVAHPAVDAQKALVAFALFATAIVFAIATISNNNLQDLKTGQLVERDAARAAMGADRRRDRRCRGDPAGAESAGACVWASRARPICTSSPAPSRLPRRRRR